MKKVYCQNCKYISPGNQFCNHLKHLKHIKKCFNNKKFSTMLIENKNTENKCADYKRIWYKFWVK